MVASVCVVGKGREDLEPAPWVVFQLRRRGLGRCISQADGEPAGRRFVKDIIEVAAAVINLGFADAHSPAYEHKVNGAVERAKQDVKGVTRSLYLAPQERVGDLSPASAIFDWMVA